MIQYPNGLLTAFGPFDGTTHDSTAAQMMELDQLISRHYTFAGINTLYKISSKKVMHYVQM